MTVAHAGRKQDSHLGRIAYAGLFVVLLPSLLVLWARQLDTWLPFVRLGSRPLGLLVAAAGAGAALHAMAVLWFEGGGLPASPFPPRRLARSGPYALFAHPIYAGAVAMSFGISLAAGSPGGLWIVTPVLAASAAAWVLGFEGDKTRERFAERLAPVLSLPPALDVAPSGLQRGAAHVLVLAPWLFLYALELLATSSVARATDWWWSLPRLDPVGVAVSLILLAFVVLATMVVRSGCELRRFVQDCLVATLVVATLRLLVPFGGGYHLAWPLLAVCAYASAVPVATRPLVTLLVLAVGSGAATGMLGVADACAAVVVAATVRARMGILRALVAGAERIANSWREWRVGPVRLLNHGVWAAIGAGLGVGVALGITGTAQLPWVLLLTATAVLGAGIWAQLVEGSPQLLRPYGYFGSVVAVGMVLTVALLFGKDLWPTTAAFCIGSTITYALGRMRCLVQGCCHGSPTMGGMGIVYRHPRSRVLRLTPWGGAPLHATQLYSALWMLLVGALLLRLLLLAAPLPLVVGTYFILTGLGRFVEEHFRGEPQTLVIGGMRLYQWLSIWLVVLGASVSTLAGPAAPAFAGFEAGTLTVLLLVTLATYVAYGVDFPDSRRRFSRLV